MKKKTIVKDNVQETGRHVVPYIHGLDCFADECECEF
jgi:hypothetical protein